MKRLTSLQHPIVKEAEKIRTSKGERYEKRLVLIAGVKQVVEAGAGEVLFVQEGEEAPPFDAKEIYRVTPEILRKITGQAAPEPVAALVSMPPFSSLKGKNWILALDGVADPGNLGTLIRTALALGWEGIYLVGPCVDPYNDKALRAAKGATFRIPLAKGSPEELIAFAEEEQLPGLVADVRGEPLSGGKKRTRLLLVLGSESHGPSESLTGAFPSVSIPISGIESLNVAAAGAIFLYTERHGR